MRHCDLMLLLESYRSCSSLPTLSTFLTVIAVTTSISSSSMYFTEIAGTNYCSSWIVGVPDLILKVAVRYERTH